jgi:hypothetical protein
MFQDEARFGRMVRIRRCWSPAPSRPKVDNGYQRKFTYVYGAVSPMQGELDWKISPQMNTEQMNQFVVQVSQAHPVTIRDLRRRSSHANFRLVSRIPFGVRS